MPESWSKNEVELIVADYFNMLSTELFIKKYSKAEHRRNILPLLNNRSEGSVEFKHQNISAILVNLGQPFIKGYVPRFNYQNLLEDIVLDHLIGNINIEQQFRQFANKEILIPTSNYNFEKILVKPPNPGLFKEPVPRYLKNPIKINYLEQEQKNQKLGQFGEKIVIQYEKWNLVKLGKEKLSESVEWISKDQGDGAGFDILSRNPNGSDKYIEVKSTKLSKESPFFFSRNELLFSIDHSNDYHLYRVFNLEEQVKIFIKKGNFNSICHSIPMTFKGYF